MFGCEYVHRGRVQTVRIVWALDGKTLTTGHKFNIENKSSGKPTAGDTIVLHDGYIYHSMLFSRETRQKYSGNYTNCGFSFLIDRFDVFIITFSLAWTS